MTWARFLATGSGTLAFRIVIAGLEIQFVSDPAMEQTLADGRRRVCCAMPDLLDFTIDESVNIPEAMLEAQGNTITLGETAAEDLSQALYQAPSVERFITADVTKTGTTINLLSTSGLSAGDVVHVGQEAIKIGTVASSTQLTGCTRGYWDTDTSGSGSNEGLAIFTTNGVALMGDKPVRIRARRVKVYAYGDGDDLTGDGTQIWTGFVKSEPRCVDAGGHWQLQIGPVTERLKSKLGGELATPMYPRGIYYPWLTPLKIRFAEDSGSGLSYGTAPGTDTFTGFYETQSAFVAALTTWLQDSSRPWNGHASTLRAEELEDGRWTIAIVVGASVTNLELGVHSDLDGDVESAFGGGATPLQDAPVDGSTVTSLSSGDVIYPVWTGGPRGARMVPRGYFGDDPRGNPPGSDPTARASAPAERIYLSRGVSTDWDSVAIEWPTYGNVSQTILDSDTSDNWIESAVGRGVRGPGDPGPQEVYTALQLPTIHPLRSIAIGSLADVRDALVSEGPAYANRGTAPFLTPDDLADWTDVCSAAERFGWLSTRLFQLSTAVDLDEFLAHEFRLRGLYPITDSDGKIALARIGIPLAGGTAIDEEIWSVGWSSAVTGNQTTNRYVLHLGYDPISDDWQGAIYDPWNEDGFAQDHQDRPLEVKPRSRSNTGQGDADITWLDAVEAAEPVLGLFGWPYDVITVHVSWKLFSLLLGDGVTFSADHLPNRNTGVRPLSQIKGTVIGRRWKLWDAHGELQILVSWQNVGGYSPTARVSSQVNDSGDQWTLTIDTSLYFTSGEDPTTPLGIDHPGHFAAGYKVRIMEYDSESPTVITGTVDAATSTTIQVTFDSTWTPGSSTWELIYDTYSNMTDDQKVYASIAGPDGLRGTGDNPNTYAP